MLTVMIQDKKELIRAQLIKKAQEQGIVTYDDILKLLPDAEREISLLDEIMDSLADAGVEVVANPHMDSPMPEDMTLDHPEDFIDEDDLDLSMFDVDQDITTDAGYQQALDTDDVVGLYLKEAGRVPLLTAEEEVSLAKRMEAGEKARERLKESGSKAPADDRLDLERVVDDGDLAQEHLVRANSRLVISVAKKYVGRGVPFLDLIQEGNIGLIRAARKFEYRRGHKFSTYAMWWIRQAISRAVADQGRTSRVPVHMGDQINRLRRVTLNLTQELGRDPAVDEIAKALDTTP